MKAYVDTSFLLARYLDEGEFTVEPRRVAARLREEPVLTKLSAAAVLLTFDERQAKLGLVGFNVLP